MRLEVVDNGGVVERRVACAGPGVRIEVDAVERVGCPGVFADDVLLLEVLNRCSAIESCGEQSVLTAKAGSNVRVALPSSVWNVALPGFTGSTGSTLGRPLLRRRFALR